MNFSAGLSSGEYGGIERNQNPKSLINSSVQAAQCCEALSKTITMS